MAQTRVQAPEFGAGPQLRPAPLPSDTFAAPEQAPIDRRFEATANALSFFSQAVGTIGTLATTVQKLAEPSEADIWAEQRRIGGMTNEEIKAGVRDGTIPTYADAFANTAGAKLVGQRYGEVAAAEFMQFMQTEFDWDNGDPNQAATDWLNRELEQHGQDPVIGAQIMAQFNQTRSQLTQFGINRANEMAVEQRTDAAFMGFESFLQHAIMNETDPAAAAASIYGSYSTLGQDGTLGVDYDALDAQLLTNVARIARTSPDLAEAILNAQGPDGRSLGGNPQMIARVDMIRSDIRQGRWDTSHAAEMDTINAANLQVLLDGGDFGGIREHVYYDVNGNRKVLSADEQRETAVSLYGQLSNARAEQYRETPQEQMLYDTLQLNRAGQLNPVLTDSLAGISQLAVPGTMMDPATENQLVEKLTTAIAVSAQNPLILQAHISDPKDRDFVEAFRIAVGTLGMNDSEAVQFAGQVVNSGNINLGQEATDRIERAVNDYAPNFFQWAWAGVSGGETYDPGNTYAIETRITDVATSLVAANGMDPERAVQVAARATQETFYPFRGQILDVGGMAVPADMGDALTAFIDDFALNNPESLTEAGLTGRDLTVIQRGSSFYIVNKNDFGFINQDYNDVNGSQGGRPRVVSLDELREWSAWRANRQAQWDAETAAAQANGENPGWEQYNSPNQQQIDREADMRGFTRDSGGLYIDSGGTRYRPGVVSGMFNAPIMWFPIQE